MIAPLKFNADFQFFLSCIIEDKDDSSFEVQRGLSILSELHPKGKTYSYLVVRHYDFQFFLSCILGVTSKTFVLLRNSSFNSF